MSRCPVGALPRGSLHPLIETQREIARIFGQFGFVTYEAPEVETDELNFQLLNIPEDHPARDLWDTLYVAGSDRRLVLRHAHVAGPDPDHARVQPADPGASCPAAASATRTSTPATASSSSRSRG